MWLFRIKFINIKVSVSVLGILFCLQLFAEEIIAQESPADTASEAVSSPTENSSRLFVWNDSVEQFENKNILGLGYHSFPDLALSAVSYQRMLTPHFGLGLHYAKGGKTKIDAQQSGDLQADQLYKSGLDLTGNLQGLSLQYFISENGHRKSGFYSKGLLARLSGQATFSSQRYGPDNGFIVVGDGTRLLEEKYSTTDYETQFLQIAIGAQLSMQAYNQYCDRLNIALEIAAAPWRTGEKTQLASLTEAREFDSRDLSAFSILLNASVPF